MGAPFLCSKSYQPEPTIVLEREAVQLQGGSKDCKDGNKDYNVYSSNCHV